MTDVPGLHPKAQELLDDLAASGRPNAHLLPVAEARANLDAMFAEFGPGPEPASVHDAVVPRADGPDVAVRVYRPTAVRPVPVVAFAHGGGWTIGGLDSHDLVCRLLAREAGVLVVAIDYRLAPEHPFPAALDDCTHVVRSLPDLVEGWGGDPTRLAVAGDSAGGNLAVAVALRLRDEGGPRLSSQVLVYPLVTTDLSEASYDDRFEGVFLYRDELLWHQANYLRSPEDARSPYVSVLDADLTGLPPTFVVLAGCDPLAPQGQAFARRLEEAGVEVEVTRYPGMIHGFFGLTMLFAEAEQALVDAAAALRRRFDVQAVRTAGAVQSVRTAGAVQSVRTAGAE